MGKFKVGDKVEVTNAYRSGSSDRPVGYIGIVTHTPAYSDAVTYLDGDEVFTASLQLATSLEKAKEILEAAGYSIIPPKPKLTGKVVVYTYDDEVYVVTEKEFNHRNASSGKHLRKVIAIVDWTEGDGLD